MLQSESTRGNLAHSQSFTLWQQVTIEIMRRDHFCYCLFTLHMYVVIFFVHNPFVMNNTFNATLTSEVATLGMPRIIT